ncbi:MAG: serine hydrolase domain-containing protein [Nitrospiria bacterium]
MKPSFHEIESLLQQSVSRHYFSAASLLVFYRGEILFQEAAGFTSWDLNGLTPDRVKKNTLFDLASLTKPLVTTGLTALFVQEETLSLDQTVGQLLDEPLSEEISNTTLKALLNHSSGLPDWKPYYSFIDPQTDRKKVKQMIYEEIHREPFVYLPGTRNVYSDLGFILLGEILEKRTGKNLDELFRQKIAGPLGLKDIGFIPGDGPVPFEKGRAYVATENSIDRKKVIQGEVHDDNAFVMGGVAGHAGLFGTGLETCHAFLEWRNGYLGKGKLLKDSTVKTFVERGRFNGDWGLGWMFPSPSSSAGHFFSKHSFGHLGFTGTSLWFDPLVDLGVIFLSNRVHPTRENNTLKEFRPLLHDRVYRTVIEEGHS